MGSFLQEKLASETFLENARSSAAPIVEWRHGYALFLQIQRFHDAAGDLPRQYMDVYVHVNIVA
jgi:hypothetical protein